MHIMHRLLIKHFVTDFYCALIQSCKLVIDSLVPRPSSTLTFGGPGMPNQMFEWVEPRQRFCTQCHYDNFLGTPTATYSLLKKSGAAAIVRS